jgi:hypothetical protein
MNTETLIKIREWEAERDRNLRIHCPLVAANFQRWIDRAKKEDDRPYSQPRDKIFNKKACKLILSCRKIHCTALK